jgi:hypothetical protein
MELQPAAQEIFLSLSFSGLGLLKEGEGMDTRTVMRGTGKESGELEPRLIRLNLVWSRQHQSEESKARQCVGVAQQQQQQAPNERDA